MSTKYARLVHAKQSMKHAQDAAAFHLPPDNNSVCQQLERILRSDEFSASRHLSRFLRFVVEETLAGRSQRIKGYNVAISVFKRPEGFDPSVDPIVRIYAGKLRRALTYYYATNGENDPVLIEVPKGHYVPTFSLAGPASEASRPVSVNRPVILVLPFQYLGSDQQQTWLSDGLTEDLVVGLARYRDIEVIAEPAVVDGRASGVNIRELAMTAGGRFVLSGSVRASRDKVRVAAQLGDGISGKLLWADSYERMLTTAEPFVVQGMIANQIVTNVADQYDGAINRTLIGELSGSAHKPTEYDAVLGLHRYNLVASQNAYIVARHHLEEAVVANPEYAMNWAGLGELQLNGYAHGHSDDDRDAALSVSFASVRKAMGLEPDCEYAHFVLGLIYLVARDREGLVQEAETLINRTRHRSLQALGAWLLAIAGHWDRGTEVLAHRMQILRHLPRWLYHVMFLNEYRVGRYEAAYQMSLKFNMPMLFWDPLERAASLGQLGRATEAREAIVEMLALRPDFADHPRRYLECFIMEDGLIEHLLDGLRKAGLSTATIVGG